MSAIRPQIVGVLLAAGSGSRYGYPKALAHDGAWLAGAISALLEGGCDEVLVVLGAADFDSVSRTSGLVDYVNSPRVSYINNPRWFDGMGSSLRAGLTASARTSAELAVIHLVDTPDIGADVIARVIEVVRNSQLSRSRSARAQEDSPHHNLREGLARAHFGTVPGHPVAIGRQFWDDVIESALGDAGAREFLRDRVETLPVQCSDLATGRDHDEAEGPVTTE